MQMDVIRVITVVSMKQPLLLPIRITVLKMCVCMYLEMFNKLMHYKNYQIMTEFNKNKNRPRQKPEILCHSRSTTKLK